MSWSKYYEDRVNNESYFLHFMTKYGPFLDKIEELRPKYMFGMGEFGCGIANTAKYFQILTPKEYHFCYDIDEDILKMARKNLAQFKDRTVCHNHDITKKMPPRRYDLIHSHGVLEHFSDIEIQNIIYHQSNMTDVMVHYVPSDKYEEPSYGDERLMSPDQWKDILSEYDVEVDEFNDGYDLTIWWNNL